MMSVWKFESKDIKPPCHDLQNPQDFSTIGTAVSNRDDENGTTLGL
jgi:hypothetical protein